VPQGNIKLYIKDYYLKIYLYTLIIKMTTREQILNEPRYYTFTKYPSIFRNCYWGRHQFNIEPTIVENRNKFVEKYNIISYKDTDNISRLNKSKCFIFHDKDYNKIEPPKDILKKGFEWNAGMAKDHIEYWTIGGNYNKSFITLFSQRKEDCNHQLILDHGYIEIAPIYATNQTTYMKIIHPDTL
jgi:hypothetical protein